MIIPRTRRRKPDDGLRAIVHGHLRHIHWQAIETTLTGPGVPDSNGCHRGVDFWVEHKATKGWRVHIEPQQVAWHLRRLRSGGRTFVAVRRHCSKGPRTPAADELWLFHGARIVELKHNSIAQVEAIVVCIGGPENWDWAAIERALILSVGLQPVYGPIGRPGRMSSSREQAQGRTKVVGV